MFRGTVEQITVGRRLSTKYLLCSGAPPPVILQTRLQQGWGYDCGYGSYNNNNTDKAQKVTVGLLYIEISLVRMTRLETRDFCCRSDTLSSSPLGNIVIRCWKPGRNEYLRV